MNKPPKLVIGQDVTIRLIQDKRVSGRARKAEAMIVATGNNGTLIHIAIPRPPEWFFVLQRSRGLWTSGTQDLRLFFDHTGNWTDANSLEHYEISQ